MSFFPSHTGSQISIVPFNKTKKWGNSFHEIEKQVLCGFDGVESESSGIAKVKVNIGNQKFIHEFVVVP